jgi:hypothetical protein
MLTWHHTEFGRRTDCLQYRIVRKGDQACQLLDADWNFLAACPNIAAAQRVAEQLALRKQNRRRRQHGAGGQSRQPQLRLTQP